MNINILLAFDTELFITYNGLESHDDIESFPDAISKIKAQLSTWNTSKKDKVHIYIASDAVENVVKTMPDISASDLIKTLDYEYTSNEIEYTSVSYADEKVLVDTIPAPLLNTIKTALEDTSLAWISSLSPIVLGLYEKHVKDDHPAIVYLSLASGQPSLIWYISNGHVRLCRSTYPHDVPMDVLDELKSTSKHAAEHVFDGESPMIIFGGEYAQTCLQHETFLEETATFSFEYAGNNYELLSTSTTSFSGLNFIRSKMDEALQAITRFIDKIHFPHVSKPVHIAAWVFLMSLGISCGVTAINDHQKHSKLVKQISELTVERDHALARQETLKTIIAQKKQWTSPLAVPAAALRAAHVNAQGIILSKVVSTRKEDKQIQLIIKGTAFDGISPAADAVAAYQKQLSWLHIKKGWAEKWPPEMLHPKKMNFVIEGVL